MCISMAKSIGENKVYTAPRHLLLLFFIGRVFTNGPLNTLSITFLQSHWNFNIDLKSCSYFGVFDTESDIAITARTKECGMLSCVQRYDGHFYVLVQFLGASVSTGTWK